MSATIDKESSFQLTPAQIDARRSEQEVLTSSSDYAVVIEKTPQTKPSVCSSIALSFVPLLVATVNPRLKQLRNPFRIALCVFVITIMLGVVIYLSIINDVSCQKTTIIEENADTFVKFLEASNFYCLHGVSTLKLHSDSIGVHKCSSGPTGKNFNLCEGSWWETHANETYEDCFPNGILSNVVVYITAEVCLSPKKIEVIGMTLGYLGFVEVFVTFQVVALFMYCDLTNMLTMNELLAVATESIEKKTQR
jgi:hypothetical protein